MIYEFIVLSQKTDFTHDLKPLLKVYDQATRTINGRVGGRHFLSFYALPAPDESPVYVLIYQWADAGIVVQARDYLVQSNALNDLLLAANIVGFALTEQIEGQVVDVETLAAGTGQVLEVAIRRVKDEQKKEFERLRKAFVSNLDGKTGVMGSAEFKATLGESIDNLTVGITVYQDQATFQTLAQELLANPDTQAYFATFTPEALKYVMIY